MDINKRIVKHFKDSAELKLKVKDTLAKPIAEGAQIFFDCVTNDGKILCCGNGGSAADAQHFAAELLNRFEKERPGLCCADHRQLGTDLDCQRLQLQSGFFQAGARAWLARRQFAGNFHQRQFA